MTGQIKKDIRQRDYFLKKARKSSRDEDWLAYKSMGNRVTNSVKRAKQTYNKKLIDNHKDDTRSLLENNEEDHSREQELWRFQKYQY